MIRKAAAAILFIGILGRLYAQPLPSVVYEGSLFCTAADSTLPDTLAMPDTTTVKKPAVQPNTPVFRGAEDANSTFLTRSRLQRMDYRTIADAYRSAPFGGVLSLGQPGQPHQPLVYGLGAGGAVFTRNGLALNEYGTGYLNPAFVLTEELDSIEFVPLARGFLYNPWGAPVTVNLVGSQYIPPRAYSRIRYLQAPNDEGSIDFRMSQFLGRNLGLLVDVANKKAESFYKNSASSYWGGNAMLRYTPASSITLRLEYGYRSGRTDLNGGVNADSILKVYGALTNAMFSELIAPVLFREMYEKTRGQSLALHADALLLPGSISSLSVYRQHSLREFRFNEGGTPAYALNAENTITGGLLRQQFTLGPAAVTAAARADRVSTRIAGRAFSYNRAVVTGSGALYVADSTIVPGVFAGTAMENGTAYAGAGADLSARFGGGFSLYAGFSSSRRRVPADTLNPYAEATDALEVSAVYTAGGTRVTLGAFQRASSEDRAVTVPAVNYFVQAAGYPGTRLTLPARNAEGLSLAACFRFGVLEAETRAVYTRQRAGGDEFSNLPELQADVAAWYRDSLFDGSLDLKAGLRARYFSPFRAQLYDPFTGTTAGFSGAGKVPGAVTVDFSASGQIQESAIVYFTIENLLDRRYFMVPYYPMPRIGFRFGLAWEFIN